MRQRDAVVAAFAAFVLSTAISSADPVDNPSDFLLTFDTGTIKIGNLDPMDIQTLSISGTVLDVEGNVFVPTSGIELADATFTLPPPIGDVTVRFEPLSDATGVLNALSGEATAALSVRVRLINPSLPSGCSITPVDIALTTGADGELAGTPYSMEFGTLTYVNNSFSVPATSGCGIIFGPIINTYIGLPSDPPRNSVDNLHGTFDPVFTGS
jgi:hypothetical protein